MTARLTVLLTTSAVVIGVAVLRFPLAEEPPFAPALLQLPDPGKLVAVLRSLGVLVVVTLAAAGLGRPVLRCFGSALPGTLSSVACLGLGFLVLADTVFLLAACHLLTVWMLAALVLAASTAGAIGCWRARRGATHLLGVRAWQVAVALGLLSGPVLAAFVPDYGWDAFVYHLAVPERYLHTNGIWVTPFSFYTAFPLTMQMLYALALALDPGPLAKLLHLEFGILTALVVMTAARRVSPRAALIAVLILAADPLFVWEMGVAFADLAGCCYTVLAAVMFSRTRTGDVRGLALAALFAGAAVAVHYRLAIVPVALVMALWWRSGGTNVRASLRGTAVVIGMTAVVMLPWLARNLVLMGNPVAPALQQVFYAGGGEFFDPIAVEQSVRLAQLRGPGRGLRQLLTLPWILTTGVRGDGRPLFAFQVGSLYLVAALGSVLLWRRWAAEERALLQISVVAMALWFLSGAHESRYVLPILALVAAPGAVAIDRLLPRRGIVTVLMFALLLAAVGHGQWKSVRLFPWRWGYALGHLSVERFEAQEPALTVGRKLRSLLGPDDRLLLLFEGRAYFFRGLDYIPYHVNEGAPTLQLVHRAIDADDLHRRLVTMGVTHVVINHRSLRTYPTVFVPGYGRADFARDLGVIVELLERHSRLLLSDRGVVVRILEPLKGP